MILFKPSLQVRSMRVYRAGVAVFDINFHAGYNIIRGENSSGKSTILDFLFYALGGDLTDWREAALLCEEVGVEVSLNGRAVTLAREVSAMSGRPMRVYPGPMDEAHRNRDKWSIFPYKRSPQKENFSQVLFRWLEMPEVVGEATSSLTMHQVLRIVYSDQVTPIDKIFRSESFDTNLVRQTIGDLLCGAFNDVLYKAQVRRREAKKEYDAAASELSSIFHVVGSTKHSLTGDWIAAEKSVVLKKIETVQDDIADLEKRIFNGEVSDGLSLDEQQKAYDSVRLAQSKLSAVQKELDELALEAADSNLYIASHKAKLNALNDASVTAEAIKRISFLYCPACFAPVSGVHAEHHCSLCKSPFDQDRSQSRILLLINDLSMQVKQSEMLQADRREKVTRLEAKLLKAKENWELVNRQYKLANRTPSTELRTRSKELHREVGYLERQLEDLNEKDVLIGRIEELSQRKAALAAEVEYLDNRIKAEEAAQRAQLEKAYAAIADNMRTLLQLDLSRQDTFQRANQIEFSFGDDRISVNGERFFSASSMVYMRNSFFVAFWQASLADKNFRHPRLLIMDTIEDKGMEPTRSHNFQKILAEISEAASVDHQIIVATSMIAPELENSNYVIGRFYTHESRTLELT